MLSCDQAEQTFYQQNADDIVGTSLPDWNPAVPFGAQFTQQFWPWRQQVDAQMPMPKTTDQTDSSSSGKAQRMSKAMDKFAPGWTIRQVGGPNMNPGLRTQWKGSDNVLVTHPESREVPCILSTRVEIPKNQSSHLILSVNNHPQGDWNLKVYINDEEVLDRRVHHGKWEELKIDLSPYVGTNVKIDLENRANNWSYEAGYWRKIEIVTE